MKPKLIIDAETAERWGREAMEAGDEGSVLAGRPPGLRVRDEQERLQRRLRWGAIASGSASVALIALAYAAGASEALALAAAFGTLAVVTMLVSARSARRYERERCKPTTRAAA